MLLGGPGPPTLDASQLLVAPVNEIFATPKNIKKTSPQKSSFFSHFWVFRIFQSRFFSILGYFGTPRGFIFGSFSGRACLERVFNVFCDFLLKNEKVKTAQNTAPVNEFGSSSACKKARRTDKKKYMFDLFFLENRSKIEPEN